MMSPDDGSGFRLFEADFFWNGSISAVERI